MILEVSIINEGSCFDVQIWNVGELEREEDLEKTFHTYREASEYVESLTQKKEYVIYHKDL